MNPFLKKFANVEKDFTSCSRLLNVANFSVFYARSKSACFIEELLGCYKLYGLQYRIPALSFNIHGKHSLYDHVFHVLDGNLYVNPLSFYRFYHFCCNG